MSYHAHLTQCLCIVLLLWTQFFDRVCALDNHTTPVSFFYSRPDLLPPAMTVRLYNESAADHGYIFITPYQEFQSGPYIFDKRGNLVWSGFSEIGPYNAHNFHVCHWQNSPHLCVFQGNQHFGYARGHGLVMNQDYKIVKTIESGGGRAALDQHEFRLSADQKSFYVSIYQQVPYDLSRLGITGGMGWVMDSIFQELNSTDNSLIFQWSALDHVSPFTSYVYPEKSDIAGTGRQPSSPWDYFHINSIVKSTLTGNYLISGRHMSTLYYINGTDGSIVWQLEAGGRSDFVCQGFNFGFQHDAEIHHEDEKMMLISLYDNGYNNANKTATASAAKFIKLDFTTMTASLWRPNAYYQGPEFVEGQEILAASQGNAQLLPNNNVFVGWGSWPRFTEHDLNGNVVWDGQVGPGQGANMVYRAYSYPWKSIPSHTRPSLWTYSRRSDAPVALYVSWNGCTETDSWNFYGANGINDVFAHLGNTKKIGFESIYSSESHYVYTFAEALDADGRSLRNSSVQLTFVPSASLAVSCNDMNCNPPPLP